MGEIEWWFPTPVYVTKIEGSKFDTIQEDFSKVYDDLKSNHKFSQRGGWANDTHMLSDASFKKNLISEYKLVEFENELTNQIHNYIRMLGSMGMTVPKFKIATSWMTLTGKGKRAHKHSHGPADIAGCYYFQTTGDDGDFYIESPNDRMLARSRLFYDWSNDKVFYKPEVGKLLLFPGWVEHGIMTNNTDSERVSVSFNVYLERYDNSDMY
jgi:uncharacterized protein (TIGR02466 family)